MRRTFRTIADELGDQPATNYIMGHADSDADMASVYRQRINDDRLAVVTNHVRRWLFGNQQPLDGASPIVVDPGHTVPT